MRKLSHEEAEPLLEAFQENELDAVTSLAVQEHLDLCLLCRQRLRWNAEADASLRRLAEATPPASAALRRSVLQIAARDRRWAMARAKKLALAATLVALLGIASVLVFKPAHPPGVMPFVEDHLRTLAKPDAVELATSDPRSAEAWLGARLPFGVRAPAAPGYRLLGARLCRIGGEPVAFLLYEHAGEKLSCFISARSQTALHGLDSVAPHGIKLGACEGRNVAAWDADGAGYVLVGGVSREALVALAAPPQIP